MTISQLAANIHDVAVSKGFWDNERNVGEMLMLATSELSEALEEWRRQDIGDYREIRWERGGKPEGFAVEIADAIIRLLDLAEGLGIDIESVIEAKMEYNRTRPKMHGKRF